ncbi:hypothetical protein [Candidatus Lokiarchaeum ossiferum]|uniref:hypothetical protein n=1 Tax=Candidatus Lokiarchaeum ossiferum TaxID=2951803 RepID=UPI00352F5F81
MGIFCSIRSPFVAYDDVWFHIKWSNEFIDNQTLSNYNEYYGKFAYHFIGSTISIFSNIDIIIIARCIGIVQIPIGCLSFYFLLKNIIKNQNLSIIITILFSITILGTILNLSQYWPTALTTLFAFQGYSQFYKRIEAIQKKQQDNSQDNRKYFSIQFLLLLSIIFVHVINAIVYIAPIIFIELILTLRNKKFLFDLFFYLGMVFLNIFINPFSSNIIDFSTILTTWWIYLLLPILLFAFYLVEQFINKYSYNLRDPSPNLFDPANSTIKIEKTIFRKYIIPIVIVVVPIIFIILTLKNKGFFPANLYITLLEVCIVSIFCSASLVGILLYRDYSLTGKVNFLYSLCVIILISFLIIANVLHSFIIRIIEIYVPFIFIGLAFYILYNFPRWFEKKKNRKYLLAIIIVNLFSGIMYQATFMDFITTSEKNFVESSSFFFTKQIYSGNSSQNISNQSTVNLIGNFHWSYPYQYYSNDDILNYSHDMGYFLHPENHSRIMIDGKTVNRLQSLYYTQNYSNVFIFVGNIDVDRGMLYLDGGNFGKLSEKDLSVYCNLDYLNRVGVSNNRKTLYWVIP